MSSNLIVVISIVIIIIIAILIKSIQSSDSCNELVCGSIVSKCLLTQSCQCDLHNCFCCKDCLYCLGDLFTECCNCLEICPEFNETQQLMMPKSQISDFDGIPELFATLTADLDDDDKWQTFRISNTKPYDDNYYHRRHHQADIDFDDIDLLQHNLQLNKSLEILSPDGRRLAAGSSNDDDNNNNCTVIFLNNCLANVKCWQYCESMGANSYRWFHDGCCECIGSSCLNYGINENRCLSCPNEDDDNNDDDDDDDDDHDDDDDNVYDNNNTNDYDNEDLWDYGEND